VNGQRPNDPAREWPTDVHVHIQPWEMMRPAALATIEKSRDDLVLLRNMRSNPGAFVAFLDQNRIGRAGIINYVAPDIMGFQPEVNEWVADFRDRAGARVLAFGGIHPPACTSVRGEMRRLLDRLRLDAIKIHPPHQDLAPDGYRTGACPELRTVYEFCHERGVPVMFHTGTSVFPGARSRLGDPLALDDVAVDFPGLKIIMAHAGRPLWTAEAFFLLRRHQNVWADISGIPPKKLLEAIPRLEEVSHRLLFGTDWPSPGVRSLRQNLDDFLALPVSEDAKRRITRDNALELFPVRGP
jgi:predicted TIM-barrel fold metal-dependent hydrolase